MIREIYGKIPIQEHGRKRVKYGRFLTKTGDLTGMPSCLGDRQDDTKADTEQTLHK